MTKIIKLIHELEKGAKKFTPPLIEQIISEFGKDPFLILIACLLSLRSKDVVTIHVCRSLFTRAKGIKQMLLIPKAELEKIIFRTGFYKNKAEVIHNVCGVLLRRFGGHVPKRYDELISIKGVGPKTANLVLGMAFDIPAICVDTHVHRISNRLGIIKTKTADQTLVELEKIIPQQHWIRWNKLLVMWGQNVCLPRGPKCSVCVVNKLCYKVGVEK